MDLIRERMRARDEHRACIGGDSRSSSDKITTQTDNRISVGSGAAQISGNQNTVQVTSSDYGAVMAGTELARSALVVNAATVAGALDTEQATFSKALQSVGTAFETGRAGDQRMLSMVGMAVVGLVAAIALFSSGKKI